MVKEVVRNNNKLKATVVALVAMILLAVGGLIAVYAATTQSLNSQFSVSYDVGENVAARIRTETYVPGQDEDGDGNVDGPITERLDSTGVDITENGYIVFDAPDSNTPVKEIKMRNINLNPDYPTATFYYTFENILEEGYIQYDITHDASNQWNNVEYTTTYYTGDVDTSVSASTLQESGWGEQNLLNIAPGEAIAIRVVLTIPNPNSAASCSGKFHFNLVYTANSTREAGTVSKALWAENSEDLTTVVFDQYSSSSSETYTGVTLGQATDISVEQNGTVNLYTNGTTGYVLSHEPIMFPEDSSYFFSTQLDAAAQLTSITKNTIKANTRAAVKTSITLKNVNTSRVRNMSNMFAGSSVTELDLSSFNTIRVRNMSSMFSGCSALTTIYISESWNTTIVSISDNMFAGCEALTNYDESATDASNAHKNDGGYLTEKVDIAGTLSKTKWLAQTVRYTELYFDYYSSTGKYLVEGVNVISGLTGVDISEEQDNSILLYTNGTIGYILANGEIALPEDSSLLFGRDSSMESTFLRNITTIHFNNINTSRVTNMRYMFWGSSLLNSLDLSGFDTRNTKDMGFMFMRCTSLTSLDLSNFDTTSVTDLSGMFQHCSNLSTIYVGDDWETENVAITSSMFG
ncbi:MAG: BspA family leucine-rich repeat surface protein, partial [Clostridia bacterium]|nr:BspA family leucine-rich repeat surface protein [Clostridia bacterium]